MKLLFVCSANVQRSVTGERLFAECPDIETKSAGTNSMEGRTQVSQELVDWADVVFVMNEEMEGHVSHLQENFDLKETEIHNLEIKDRYFENQPELKRLLIKKVSKHIDLKECIDHLLEDIKND